ncbi:adenosylcobinamide amidohydrolase [Methanoculleus chikugoensis]|uniref:adenosylcobinamide amidohydrolase n=1 Tax=Methanoculleus chikugoensis TaxID=118126 RepID=UPI001FB2B054|nr:adenosylcobinamide amidohydrolase [Methanoculleus chikugoensis]
MSTGGVRGGIADVTTVLNHTVPHDFEDEPGRHLDLLTARHGVFRDYFGLLTAVEMHHLCVLQYDFVTVFITAGVTNPTAPPPPPPRTPSTSLSTAGRGMVDSALLETIVTATGAKAQALHDLGYDFPPGTTTDAVVVACERDAPPQANTYAGTLTEVGSRVHAAVLRGLPEALARQQGRVRRSEPSFFIYSRYGGGDHWVEWQKENCPYYPPCHFPGQRCDYCYCPCYPLCGRGTRRMGR